MSATDKTTTDKTTNAAAAATKMCSDCRLRRHRAEVRVEWATHTLETYLTFSEEGKRSLFLSVSRILDNEVEQAEVSLKEVVAETDACTHSVKTPSRPGVSVLNPSGSTMDHESYVKAYRAMENYASGELRRRNKERGYSFVDLLTELDWLGMEVSMEGLEDFRNFIQNCGMSRFYGDERILDEILDFIADIG